MLLSLGTQNVVYLRHAQVSLHNHFDINYVHCVTPTVIMCYSTSIKATLPYQCVLHIPIERDHAPSNMVNWP